MLTTSLAFTLGAKTVQVGQPNWATNVSPCYGVEIMTGFLGSGIGSLLVMLDT